jgi:hypothetical protein
MGAVTGYEPEDVARCLARVRARCLALPETSERPSHGRPAFFLDAKTCFVMFLDNHHDDGRLAVWCAAPEGAQAEMVETDPDRFFRPPYVGHRGWLGVHLLTVEDAELAAIVRDAFLAAAPPAVRRLLE